MTHTRANPRCEDDGGELEASMDQAEKYLRCPTCGFTWDVPTMADHDEWRAAFELGRTYRNSETHE